MPFETFHRHQLATSLICSADNVHANPSLEKSSGGGTFFGAAGTTIIEGDWLRRERKPGRLRAVSNNCRMAGLFDA